MTALYQSGSDEKAVIESLKDDPEYAVVYLNAILEDGDQEEILLALRRMTAAFGGIPAIAAQAELNPTSLYRTLSENGNPELRSFISILRTMGLRLAVQPISHV
jgi:probable addiction module antidote protein